MTKYSRRQEDRAEKKLTDIGFRLIEDTGRRKTGRGDKVMHHDETGVGLTIDHKSTRGKEGIRIERRALEKIRKEAAPGTTPCITFSFLGSHKIYVIFDIEDLEGVIW